jgi:quinol monooxygenase YgiN
MSDRVVIIGTFDVGAAARDRAEELFTLMNTETHKEPGCLHYAFTADLSNANRFHLSEIWVDEGALAAHLRTPHMATFLATLPELDCTREVTKWEGTPLPLG